MKKRLSNPFKGDKVIWVVFILLTLISLIAVFSSIGRTAVEVKHSTPFYAFIKHLVFVVGAYIAVIVVSNFNYRRFSRISQVLYVLCLALLFVMLFIIKARWLIIPGVGQFQPSEVAKIVLVVFLARQLTTQRDHLDEPNTFWWLMGEAVLVAGLILPGNLSTAAIVMVVAFIMFFFGGLYRKYLMRTFAILGIVAVVGIGVAYSSYSSGKYTGDETGLLARASTWGHRIDSWIHPDVEDLTQENMARMAVASGGMFGVGVGNTVHARLMTQADNDFIFAIIIEEMGAVAGVIVFILYSILFYRCLNISRRCRGLFGSLTLVGLGSLIYIQALVNMLVAVGVFPVTGQTLPLISSGGTAYLCMGVAIGIIQSIAFDSYKNEKALHDKRRDDAAFEEVKELSDKLNANELE